MKMDYTHYDEDKQTSKELNEDQVNELHNALTEGFLKSTDITQDQIKSMAREMVGDGQTPNLWFVTYGPHVAVHDGDMSYDFELIEGYDENIDTETFGPFTSYEDALRAYNKIELSFDYGVGQAFIEDRECGTVTEKWLYKRVRIEYVEDEYDNSKRYYKK
jgi:hypothetical protein